MVHFVIICASFVLLEPGSPRVYKLRPAQARCDARSHELTFKAEHLKSLNERLSDQKQAQSIRITLTLVKLRC